MVEWLAGNRIRGTSAEKPVLGLPSGSVGGWKELARTTLGSAGDLISVASLPDKRYYMILGDYLPSGNFNGKYRFNNDSGYNYARRNSGNGAADTTAVSQTEFQTDTIAGNNFVQFDIGYVANLSTKEKLIQMHTIKHDGDGAGTLIKRIESVGKWANTSDTINRIDCVNASAGDFAIGSECVVLGWDPADTHTTNFWEELASVELGSAGDTLDTSTFTAKKYLWVQAILLDSSTIRPTMQFNSDGGGNYPVRYSTNGSSDSTAVSQSRSYIFQDTGAYPFFVNMFIINNSANEKLFTMHGITQNTAGAGTASNRVETVGKWVNISSQITSIQMLNDQAGSFNTGSIIKVWGHD